MGIPQAEHPNKSGLLAVNPQTTKTAVQPANKDPEAPEIPPRMKKKGPELPEKPPHLRLTSLTKAKVSVPSSQKEVVKDSIVPVSAGKSSSNGVSSDQSQKLFLSNARKKSASADREILIAATKGARDRPPEKRQREPAKLLTPISKVLEDPVDNPLPVLLGLSSPNTQRRNNAANMKIESYRPSQSSKLVNLNQRIARHPVILIPRSQLHTRNLQQFWNSCPVSYSVWVQNSGSGDPQVTSRLVKKAFNPNGGSTVELRPGIILSTKNPKKAVREPQETKIIVSGKNAKSFPASGTSVKPRSSSVTRSGSLTSHGSTSSDSGNETVPKSVLKKHRRENTTSLNNNKSVEQKKNVTFNAFATVQLMDE